MSPSRSRRRRPRKKKNNKKLILIVCLLAVVAVIIVAYTMLGNNASNENVPNSNKVLLTTSMGNILIELRDDMPITTGNFKNLVQQGVYDGTIFHRVKDDFMIQGGAPIGGDILPSIPDEFIDNNKNTRGTVAMANAGPNTGSSQFFINVVYNSHLDDAHPVFGNVLEGMDVVDKISLVETDDAWKPLQDVILIKAQFVD